MTHIARPVRTRGAEMLAAVAETAEQIAARLGKSPSYVTKLRTGISLPSAQVETMLALHYKIPPTAWRELAADSPVRRPAAADPSPADERATPDVVEREADRLLRAYRELEAEVMAADADPAARVRVMSNMANILTQLGKLTGVGLVVSRRQILASPNWAIIRQQIIDALSPHPWGADAARAIADALDDTKKGD